MRDAIIQQSLILPSSGCSVVSLCMSLAANCTKRGYHYCSFYLTLGRFLSPVAMKVDEDPESRNSEYMHVQGYARGGDSPLPPQSVLIDRDGATMLETKIVALSPLVSYGGKEFETLDCGS